MLITKFGVMKEIRKRPLINLIGLFRFSSKRIVPMKSAKVSLENQIKQQTANSSIKLENNVHIPQDWEIMSFDNLCGLKPEVLRQLQLQVLKEKMSVGDEKFKAREALEAPEEQLEGYWLNILQTFCNKKNIEESKIQKSRAEAYLGRMYLDQPLQDLNLQLQVQKFVNVMRFPQKMETIAQPTFCKYLLGLRRDLLMRGVDIDEHWPEHQMKVQILQVLSYEYQFWVDAKHNRAKNGHNEDQYIIEKKLIDNPNTTIILQEEWPKVHVTYITRKKKRKEYQMCFCTKVLLLVSVDGNLHTVKVEKKGPSSHKNTSISPEAQEEYKVIDYDGIYGGNPTVRPIFNF